LNSFPSHFSARNHTMAEEGIEVEEAAAGTGDGDQPMRSPKATGNKPQTNGTRKRGSDDPSFVPRAMKPGDEARGVAAGNRECRDRRPATNVYYERDADDDVGRNPFSLSPNIAVVYSFLHFYRFGI
jgi:hypothetical protein